MASIDMTIVMIAMPAIFKGIQIEPFSSFQYLLWIMFGYSIVTATLLVTFGRLSDIYGRVKLYNLGFAIFTVGSILLSITPNTGNLGSIELIVFRIIQGIGGAFLFSNSAAIITDAFPENERGKALGINSIAYLVGSLVGLILGGVLAVYDWRLVFLVSVPVGVIGTIWSYWKLKELNVVKKKQKMDYWGNLCFGSGLTLILIGITYGLLPFGDSQMGWGNPWVITTLLAGTALLITFPFIERKVQDPMFKLDLFKIRVFSAGNIAGFLQSMSRGGIMIMLILLLQGIWLPLQGFSYADTPFWAGIFMIPMTLGVALMGPLSGWLSDKHGSRLLSTLGLIISGITLLAFIFLPANFDYLPFAIILFVLGIAGGLFNSPNMAAIMNSVPAENRGAASGMRATLQNCGMLISQAIFFAIIIITLNATLPAALTTAVTNIGIPLSEATLLCSHIPASGAIFAAFLGYNPMGTIINSMGLATVLPQNLISELTGQTFFPNAIATPFMSALGLSFLFAAIMCFIAAIFSAMRGPKDGYKKKDAIKEKNGA